MRILNKILLLSALLGLSACATVAGVGTDITKTANSTAGYLAGH